MLKGLYILNSDAFDRIYGLKERHIIGSMVNIYAELQTRDTIKSNPQILHDADVIFSGWGGPVMDAEFLSAAPNLKAVFYGAGSIKYLVTDAFWNSGILITSAFEANAVPVAEYTFSQIIFCLKNGYRLADLLRKSRTFAAPEEYIKGTYGSTVGLISLGMVGSKVCELLKLLDVNVIAYDPFVSKERAQELGVELCYLDDIFRRADVVSLHTPWLKETENMICGRHFEMMKPYSSFINTARGAVVNETEMIEVLEKRCDIQAVLDVTYPEPPKEDSLLYTLPNVVLTPHIAGSMKDECWRMAAYMIDELERYINGEPLKWGIDKEKASKLA